MPGIRRRRRGGGFTYTRPDGATVKDPAELRRIRRLAVPPAWTEVWISPTSNGHIQAVGRDARGRKQYRYHDRWTKVRDETKFDRVTDFGEALRDIRDRVDADLRRPDLGRRRVVATVVRLLDSTSIRVGNEEYARTNGTYGLTTMRENHVAVAGSTVRFQFRGKSGAEHSVEVADRRVARVVQRCLDLPGEDLFKYRDDEGALHTVRSDDVNDYLREVTGRDFTAKDFRTWAGTVMAATALWCAAPCATQRERRRAVGEAVRHAATHLRNTPAVCRRAYIHPEVLAAYAGGTLGDAVENVVPAPAAPRDGGLSAKEAAVLALLRSRRPVTTR